MKKIFLISIIILICLVLSLNFINATCTVSLDKDSYIDGEIATIDMICSSPLEQSQSYTMNWTNSSGYQVHLNTGTTPAIKNTYFFDTYSIDSTYSTTYGSGLNVTLTGTNLEGKDNSTITVAGASDLIINNINIRNHYLEKYASILFKVMDDGGNAIANAQCVVDIIDGNDLPIISSSRTIPSQGNGYVLVSQLLIETAFDVDESYKWNIACTCFNTTSSYSNIPGNCYKEDDGTEIKVFKHGEIQYPFTIVDLENVMVINKTVDTTLGTGIWVENSEGYRVNMTASLPTLWQDNINWSAYNQSDGMAFLTAGEKFRVCMYANNTMDGAKNIKLNHLHLMREPGSMVHSMCISGERCEDKEIMHIEIQEGNYQKCGDWIKVPNYIKGQNNWKIAFLLKIEGYKQEVELNSDRFTIFGEKSTKDYIPLVDIINVTTNYYGSTVTTCTDIEVNMTYDFFGDEEDIFLAEYCFEQTDDDYQAGCYETIINPDEGTNEKISQIITLPYFETSGKAEVYINIYKISEAKEKSYIVGYGDTEPFNTFNIIADTSDSCKYSQNLDQKLRLRKTEALEGIENKTGTFHFDVDCPATAEKNEEMDCKIIAFIEDSQLIQKEVDFTCYISTTQERLSSLNFNQMITRIPQTFNRKFLVTNDLAPGEAYTLQCEAGYYNLGLRTDRFFDTFIVTETIHGTQGASVTGDEIIDKAKEIVNEIVAIILIIILACKKKKKPENS